MKKRGMKKRVLAALMTACMVVGSVPGVSLADVSGKPSGTLTPDAKKYNFDGSASTAANPDIELNKTAVYNADTNDYTITLSAKAKEKVETKKTHVVFLLDASGSMNFCTNNTIREVPWQPVLKDHAHYYYETWKGKYVSGCTEIDKNPTLKSRWKIATESIKSMTDELGSDNISYDYTWFNEQNSQGDGSGSENPYSNVTPEGGTFLTEGVKHALKKFESDDSDTDKVMVIVADGETSNNNYPTKELKSFKSATNNGKVYTVGFTFSSEGFKSLANGSDYNFNATDEDSLKVALNQISQKIKTGITDPLGNNVELVGGITVDGSEAVANYDSAKNEITWNDPNGLDENGVSLTYHVKVKDTSDAGSVDLNGDAVLSYTAGSENHTVEFPKPSITGAKLTVKYTEQGTENVVKTDNDWIGFTGGNVSFKKITEIPERILVDGTTYYVVSSDPEAIPTPTEAINYIVNVQVSKDKPNQAIYSVIYDANGGTWKKGYEAQEPYTLNPERSMLTRAGMNYGDIIEILDGNDAPEYSGYVFKGWQLGEDKLVVRVPVGRAADSDHQVHLSAIWEEDGSTSAETVTYVVNKHYFDTDTEKSVYDESVDVNQTAEKGSLISSKVAGLMTTQNYYYTDYLYDHATVTVESTTTEYTEASVFQPGRNIIDLYYYRDSWNKNDGSETGGDGIPDNKQVLVKFGNKDGNGTVTDGENADNNGTVQVYTLEEKQKNVTPSLEGVKVEAAEGHEFTKWTKGNNSASVKPDIAWMVKGGDEIDFWAWFDAKEPESPELPTDDELKALIDIALIHTGSNADHNNERYPLLPDSYTVASASDARAIVTVNADAYVEAYNDEYGTHTLVGRPAATLTFKYGGSAWELADGTVPVTFTVKCTENNPEKPDLPKYDDLKKLFGETINVTCETDEQHAPQSFGLMAGTYSVTRDKEDDNEAVVTVFAKDYIKAYADGKHTNAGDDAATVKLIYDEDGKWYSENQEIVINFKAKCEKTPETPEKQYTEIKFVVVNGTFTENGQTELTKTFEVGTKLTLADIPASKGKSSSYSDQTWDKFPVGYVVGKDGTTFTITYRWRSSSSDSDDSDYDYGTSTRGKATNAAGKSGRWILEGGEFTEDNGRLPSNEYLKIGDTIYGFYTYGFAIDFDRPEYYTDAAIQAKGGYRDATGTWRLNGWWFCYDDGTFPHDEWVYLTWNGRSDWYYFDVDGWMEDGWLYRNNNWYYLHTQYDNTRGHMYTGWHEIDGKWYYFNTASDKGTLGVMLANTTTPDGYQVDANGAWIR